MGQTSLHSLFRHIRGLAADQGEAHADRVLLERFLTRRDEAAFAALVHRHGSMVLGVCRRWLSREQDAEDAWQATFLVLACRGGGIRKRDSLGSWLHGVAYRVARKLRADLARRQGEPLPDLPAEVETRDVGWREVQAILDEE